MMWVAFSILVSVAIGLLLVGTFYPFARRPGWEMLVQVCLAMGI